MKKLIFLFIAVFAIVGFASAMDNAAQPPGAIALDAALAGYGVAAGHAVTPDTVLAGQSVIVSAATGYAGEYSVAQKWNNLSGEFIKPIDTGQGIDYPMRL